MTSAEAIERVRAAVERIDPSRVRFFVNYAEAWIRANADPRVTLCFMVNKATGETQRRCRRETGNGSPAVVRAWTKLRNAGAVRNG
jgi:hypothetical protein